MGKTILLVEDDTLIQEMVADFFEAEGWQVHCTDRGKEALRILRTEDISLILLDIMISGMNGFETCRTIREESCCVFPAIRTLNCLRLCEGKSVQKKSGKQ